MIRVVIDTNIALSGFIGYTTIERKLINYAMRKDIILIGSQETFNEFSRKIDENEHFRNAAKGLMFPKEKLRGSYKAHIRYTEIKEEFAEECYCEEDPDDDAFIKTALSAKVEIIVTRDKHLLRLNGIEGLRIVRPEKLLKSLKKRLG